MTEKKQCSQCGNFAVRYVVQKDGSIICGRCLQDRAQPPCQFPNCKIRCDAEGHILCDPHFRFYLNGGFPPELEQTFKEKFAEMGLSYKIIKRTHTPK